MPSKKAFFNFYYSLNDFLSKERKNQLIEYPFSGKPSVKDAIEAIGVPHVEVDIILINKKAVDFSYQLQNEVKIEVYPLLKEPCFPHSISLSNLPRKPLNFIADVHLGKLARLLRMLGFDTYYNNEISDRDIIKLTENENRIVLTRDVFLLKNKKLKSGQGYWLRSENPEEQLTEVLKRFVLFEEIKPFVRCIDCNGIIEPVSKSAVIQLLPPKTIQYFDEFYRCANCGKIYWKGSHYDRMLVFIELVKKQN